MKSQDFSRESKDINIITWYWAIEIDDKTLSTTLDDAATHSIIHSVRMVAMELPACLET